MNWPDDYVGKVIEGDCLDVMPGIPDKSVDMILCDLPYGTTACKWDVRIPLEPLWECYKRIVKDRAAIVLTARQPFTSVLVMSNLGMFKYCWVWDKRMPTDFHAAKYRPLSQHEDVVVFSAAGASYGAKLVMVYLPVMTERTRLRVYSDAYGSNRKNPKSNGLMNGPTHTGVLPSKYPKTILDFSTAHQKGKHHPTQKPVALFEYLIKTYTNPGELVLDNCIGSGTTAVACINTGRRFIGIEKEAKYCEIARGRITESQKQPALFTQEDQAVG